MHRKQWLFSFGLVLIAYVSIEVFSFALYYAMEGKIFSFAGIENRQKAIIDSVPSDVGKHQDIGNAFAHSVPHPYLGFVFDPQKLATQPRPDQEALAGFVTPDGFFAERDPMIATRDPDTAIIALVGGSMAQGVFQWEHDFLHDTMKTLPQFHGKKIDIIMLGRTAYNQPQQLLLVAYYLMKGGRLDMVINLDGYNDIQHPLVMQDNGVYPSYPRLWPDLFAGTAGSANLPAVGNVMMWRHFQTAAVRVLRPLDFSVTASVVWSFMDHYCQRNKVQADMVMDRSNQNKRPYFLTGPDTFKESSQDELLIVSANLWQEGSRQLQALSELYHFPYFHFLQPNQYVTDSKILTPDELANAYAPDEPFNHAVTEGYHVLEAGIGTLHQQGENAYSLTDIYRNVPETVYIDSCCHVNQRGNQILAQAITEKITAYFQTH